MRRGTEPERGQKLFHVEVEFLQTSHMVLQSACALLLLVVAVSGEDPPWKDHGVICDTKECNFDCLCQKLAWVRRPLPPRADPFRAPFHYLPEYTQPHALDLIPRTSIPPWYPQCPHRACQ